MANSDDLRKRVDEFFVAYKDAQSKERLAWEAWADALKHLQAKLDEETEAKLPEKERLPSRYRLPVVTEGE